MNHRLIIYFFVAILFVESAGADTDTEEHPLSSSQATLPPHQQSADNASAVKEPSNNTKQDTPPIIEGKTIWIEKKINPTTLWMESLVKPLTTWMETVIQQHEDTVSAEQTTHWPPSGPAIIPADETPETPNISQNEATALVLAGNQGEILRVKLLQTQGLPPQYRIKMITTTGEIRTLYVNEHTGLLGPQLQNIPNESSP